MKVEERVERCVCVLKLNSNFWTPYWIPPFLAKIKILIQSRSSFPVHLSLFTSFPPLSHRSSCLEYAHHVPGEPPRI